MILSLQVAFLESQVASGSYLWMKHAVFPWFTVSVLKPWISCACIFLNLVSLEGNWFGMLSAYVLVFGLGLFH